MELIVKTTGKDQYRDKIKMLVTGPSGSGKTPFAATAPNVLFADCKAGLMSIADKGIPFVTIGTEKDLIALKNLLDVDDATRTAKFGRPVDTLVLDTGDEFGRVLLAERMMTERRSEATPGDYGFVGQRLHTVIEVLTDLPINVIVLVHYREMGKDDDVRIIKPGFAGQFADQCGQYFDYSVAITSHTWVEAQESGSVEHEYHYLKTKPDQTMDFLFDRSHRLPGEFELNFKDDFERIQALVKRDDIADTTSTAIEITEEPKTTRPPRPVPQSVTVATPPADRSPYVPPPTPAPESVTVPTVQEDPLLPAAHPKLTETTIADLPPEAPAPAPAAPAEATTPAETTDTPCTDCGKMVETDAQKTMSEIRYREPVCSGCFVTRRLNSK